MTTKRLTGTAAALSEMLEKRGDELASSVNSLSFSLAASEAVEFIDAVDKAQDDLAARWAAGEPRDEGWSDSWVDVSAAALHLGHFFLWWASGLEQQA